jgi:hypothetical protein
MENVKIHGCILDACTILHLLRIDEDEILVKMLLQHNVKIPEQVLTEVNQNYKNLFIQAEQLFINQQIAYFYPKVISNATIKNDLSSYFSKIRKFVDYKKKDNGELYSTALALCLSRLEGERFYFYTDDYPAKETFSKVFEFQNIGQILDSVDLLVYFYWTNSNFKYADFMRFFSSLFNLYFKDFVEFQKKIDVYILHLPRIYIKNSEFLQNLLKLNFHLKNFQFDKITRFLDFFSNNKWKNTEVFKLVKKHQFLLELGSNPNQNIYDKLIRTRSSLKKFEIFKIV